MMKTNFILLILFILIVISAEFINLAGSIAQEKIETSSWTKAICQGNECQDFLILCSGKELIEMKPLTGLIVFSDSWVDTRSQEQKERVCDR